MQEETNTTRTHLLAMIMMSILKDIDVKLYLEISVAFEGGKAFQPGSFCDYMPPDSSNVLSITTPSRHKILLYTEGMMAINAGCARLPRIDEICSRVHACIYIYMLVNCKHVRL